MAHDDTLDWERRHWSRIDELFTAADELPEDEREAFLNQECGDDRRLVERVAALLAAEVETADAVGGLAAELSPFAAARDAVDTSPDVADEPVPDRIGSYDVLHEVGRGGSSSVFLAVRADGVFRKHVALKLVRRGLDTQDILRRLHRERQILARLDHPNIARLLDGGSLPDGRPYLVMDYAEGLPIDEDCQRRGLDVRQRIELFIEVCRAVHFAHQNLTIHRDIKPSNILVTADGTPKLLDFGIAKVLEPTEGLSLQVTGPGVRFMTPAYASPEQLRGDVLSTSTDVYSLGVLLHRLLTGVLPYKLDRLSLRQADALLDAPPPRPSQRIDAESMESIGLPAASWRRHRTLLAGDLDTIVAMALRVEPERRYGSAEQLAEDLQRHLDGLPVRAQADRWSYRAKKFVVRHARALTVAACVVLLLASVVTFFSIRLIHERDRAFQASIRAELESSKSAQVTEFLQQIFEVSNPSRSLGESVTAVQLLDRGAAQIDTGLAAEPEVQASMKAVIGQSYAGLGLYPEAEAQLERSFALRRDLFRSPHAMLAESHQQLANLRAAQGRLAAAHEHLTEAFEQRLALFGPNDPRTAESQADLGALAHLQGRFDEAEALYRQARARLRKDPGPMAPASLQIESNLVSLLYHQRRYDEAATVGRRVVASQTTALGAHHPDTIATEAKLIAILVADDRHAEAEPLLRELWRRQTQLLGPEHPDVALAANNLAAVLFYLGRYDEAEPLYRRALDIQTAAHGSKHPRTIGTMLNLADLHAIGRHDDATARPLYESALTYRREIVPSNSLDLVDPLISLGELELRAERPEAAESHLREAIGLLSAERPESLPQPPRGRLAEAERLLGDASRQLGRSVGDEGREPSEDAADALDVHL
ncbi:MAG: serine/threonine-protein kinase [Acidobacteriota bacterium]